VARSLDLSGRHFAIWAHSTVAADPMREILALTGARVSVFGRSDAFTPVDTEAVSPAARAEIAECAKRERPDAILSADADGDRPLVADGDGNILPGDLVAFSAALALGAGNIVTPVTSNSGIEREFAGTVGRTRIGSPFVLAAMQALSDQGQTGIVGFEANGGLLTGSTLHLGGHEIPALPTRDSALPILALLSRLGDPAFDLRALRQFHRFRPARSDRIENYPAEAADALLAEAAGSASFRSAVLSGMRDVTFADRIDGICLQAGPGTRLRLRQSGNAPELRLYAEAETDAAAERLIAFAKERAMDFREKPAPPQAGAPGASIRIQA
jgi:phosphomannomutase